MKHVLNLLKISEKSILCSFFFFSVSSLIGVGRTELCGQLRNSSGTLGMTCFLMLQQPC